LTLALVFLGPPGAGKGTQAGRCANRRGLTHVSTGDLFRENLEQQTPVGLMAKGFMDRGMLVPDEVVCQMVRGRLEDEDTEGGFILDGFPRTEAQAETLTGDLGRMQRPLTDVISFDLDDDRIRERICGRLTCRECKSPFHRTLNPPSEDGVCDGCGGELYTRDDDREEAVGARLGEYRDKTAPLLRYYGDRGLLRMVDASGSVDDVFRALERVLEDR